MHPRSVIIVDPDPVSLDWLAEVLSDAGFSPVLLGEPTRVQSLIRDIRPAAVILASDIERLGDGWDLLYQLRADRDSATIPVIVTATDPHAFADPPAFVRLNPCPMLVKPVLPGVLVTTLREALGAAAAEGTGLPTRKGRRRS